VIVDKIGRIMAGPYPAFGAAMERLLALDAGLLDARWPDFVAGAFAQR
jgi:hypothetical protein